MKTAADYSEWLSTPDIVPQSGAEVNGGVRWSVSAAMLEWADSLSDASTTRSSVESGLPNLPYSPDSYVAAMVAGDKLVGNVRNPDEYKRLAKVLGELVGPPDRPTWDE